MSMAGASRPMRFASSRAREEPTAASPTQYFVSLYQSLADALVAKASRSIAQGAAAGVSSASMLSTTRRIAAAALCLRSGAANACATSSWTGKASVVRSSTCGMSTASSLADFSKPDRMQVSPNQVAVRQFERRWAHDPAYHRLRAFEVILVVRALCRAISDDQGRLARPTRPAGSLRIVGRSRRHVAQVNRVQCRNVDAELHRRRTEKRRQRNSGLADLAHHVLCLGQTILILQTPAESPFPPLPTLLIDLGSMLTAFLAEQKPSSV